MSTQFRLLLPEQFYQEMLDHGSAEFPQECCGLLGGKFEGDERLVEAHSPLRNVHEEASIRYEADPREILRTFRKWRANGWDMLATYHTHPTSAPFPSRTDMAKSMGEGVVHLIISLAGAEPEMRGWWITPERYDPADWELVS